MRAGAANDAPPASRVANETAQRFRVGGRVQGVGFRPFVYRLARHFELCGWVRNLGGAVEIHAQGPAERLRCFAEALLIRAPHAARATLLEVQRASLETHAGFCILPSVATADRHVHVPMDLYTCEQCLAELRDATARRFRYPFINCTQCGPRYTLIRSMPYDRPHTTLAGFRLCRDCAAEYCEPLDRRFHAEPLGCALCGPALDWRSGAHTVCGNEPALAAALAALRHGQIVAVRGVGGYHLLCDAADEAAVSRLRARKGRPAKPLALMVPWRGSDGLDYVRTLARVTPLERAMLVDAARPIVLAARRGRAPVASGVAPGLTELALMLPYSPLHHLLLDDFGAALVATSANVSGEPVLIDPEQAHARLASVADGFLDHNRPIARPADDPVVRVVAGAARPLRLGRGTAPLEISLPRPVDVPTLAVGAYLKCTVALAWGERAVVSPHIGDLTSPRGREVFAQVVNDLQHLYGVRAERIVHDAHPGFPSSQWARAAGLPTQAVWHHDAHASAVAGEYPSEAALLCFTWDGIGLGRDHTLWGGEALLGGPGCWSRVASLRPFRLPGGERAAREPWRSALALSWECGHDWAVGERLAGTLLRSAFDGGVNSPATTAVGRLFDAAAALLGVCSHASYEGEAPMLLEALCEEAVEPLVLPLVCDAEGLWRSDWAPLCGVLQDASRSSAARAALFHSSLARVVCDQARAVREQSGVARVGLGGGVFQNRVLTEQAVALLTAAGFEVALPAQLPVNDASISYGQLVETAAIDARA